MKEFLKSKKMSVAIILLLLISIGYGFSYIEEKKNGIIEEIEFASEIEVEEEQIIVEEKSIFVDVGGEVTNSGLYKLPENARVNDAIIAAGGISKNACLDDVNLAYKLSDGEKIVIPKKQTQSKSTVKKVNPVVSGVSASVQQVSDGLVNINNATKEELKILTGIGDATAQKIIDYRNSNGLFKKKEDIKNVSGIGDAKYNSIKDKIKI